MATREHDTQVRDLAAILSEEGLGGLGKAIEVLINESMLIEREGHLGAKAYERSCERRGYANGFKPKQLKTRLGEVSLQIPQVREGNFYPSFLERGLRSERALSLSLAEMYVQGVSTRKVSAILEELCGLEVTSSQVSRAAKLLDEELSQWRSRPLGRYRYLILDARYEKVRQGGCVVDSAVLIGYGITAEGKRHVLGISVDLSEAEVHWRAFLEGLTSRGLHGLEGITSDAHAGLKAAIKATFPSVPWQRCQFHLQQNAQAYVPRQSMKREVAESLRTIFNAPNKIEAERLLREAVKEYQGSAPKLSEWMENAIPEGLTIFHFEKAHQKRLRTSNLAERINREIKRRTRVAGIFASPESCERLITALLMEVNEEWDLGKIYLSQTEE